MNVFFLKRNKVISIDVKRHFSFSSRKSHLLFIKKVLRDMFGDKIAHSIPMLYGGSVSADSAPSFVGDGCIDGFLIGRASLDAKEFKKIAAAV
jgi:triosephosphate isomerase